MKKMPVFSSTTFCLGLGCVMLAAAAVVSEFVPPGQERISRIAEMVRASEDRLRALEDQMRAAEDQVQAAEDQVRAAEDQVRSMEDQMRSAQDQIGSAEVPPSAPPEQRR